MNLAAEIERLKEYCGINDIPLTQQRLEVYKELACFDGHPSPEEIHKRLRERYPTISLSTVYNNLEALAKIGFARKVNPLSDHARYDADLSSHVHFICTSCKTVYDVRSDAVESIDIPDPVDFEHEITRKYIQYIGICKQCKNSTQEEK